MGYDMYVVDEFGRKVDGEHCYLRRNLYGQDETRECLLVMGAVFGGYDFASGWTGRAHVQGRVAPAYPGDEHFAVEVDERFPDVAWPDPSRPITETGRRFHAAERIFLRWAPEHPGIPLHKLSDNSGWWVTVRECEEALTAIDTYDGVAQVGIDFDPMDGVVDFLRAAVAHAGFRVW